MKNEAVANNLLEVPDSSSGDAEADKAMSNRSALSGKDMAAYASYVPGSVFFYASMFSILPGIYATDFGLELTTVSLAVLIMRLFDGITDPTIGYLADRHRANGGLRKIWALVGGLGVLVACYALFTPPEDISLTYYLGWSLVYFLAFTVAEIPHMAWGSELTTDYNQRAQIFGVRNIAGALGGLMFFALPLLPHYADGRYTPDVLRDAVWIGVLLMVSGLAWMWVRAPVGADRVASPAAKDSIKLLIRSLASNKPLQVYFAGYLGVGLSLGMWFGLLFLYLDGYLGLGRQVAWIFVLSSVVMVLSTPLWLMLIKRTNKHRAWMVGMSLFGLQLLGVGFVDQSTPWWIPMGLVMLGYMSIACHNTAALSVLGDIVDYDQWKSGQDRSATFFAIKSLLFKVVLGLGSALSLGIAGGYGFDPSLALQGESALWGLKLGFVLLPAGFAVMGMIFIAQTPLDRRRHRVIERRLKARHLRTSPRV